MHGFAAFISFEKPCTEISFDWKPIFEFQHAYTKRQVNFDLIYLEQFTSEKYLNEKLWINTKDYFIVTEGIINNLNDLYKEQHVNNPSDLISKIYDKPEFFSSFTGHFSGIILNKKTKSICAFGNQSGTKKIFYYIDNELAIISSDLYTLSKSLNKLHLEKTLNIEAAYLLLTSGYMHENLTLINEVKQLRAGEYCILTNKQIQVKSYYNLDKIAETKDTKEAIINKLDFLFRNAIRLEFEIDKKHNYKHLTTLSGGLDSRMTALIAYKMGYKDQMLLNFSEKGYADEIIAKKIADDYKMQLIQIELNAESMNAIDEVVAVNDGLTIYTGSSHVLSAIKKLKSNDLGVLHTGMIGDAVMGSFVTKKKSVKPNISSGLYSEGLKHRTEKFLNATSNNYASEELYKFYNRAFLGANNGFLFYDLIGESSSPFLHPEFMSYAYSIPRKYKYKERIYIDWMKKMHPDIANYTWELIGGKPTNNEILRKFYRFKRAIIKRLPIKTMWKNTMSPEQVWYDKNEVTRKALDTFYSNNIDLLSDYKELKTDLIKLYSKGNITEKSQVLTLLSAYKLLF